MDDHIVLFEQSLATNRESKTTRGAETKARRKLRDLLNTVQQLQQDRDNSRHCRLPTKSQRKNVQVPSSCQVNTIDVFVTVVRLHAYTFFSLQLRLLVKFEQQHVKFY